jgi:hypothetical protein
MNTLQQIRTSCEQKLVVVKDRYGPSAACREGPQSTHSGHWRMANTGQKRPMDKMLMTP